MINTVDGDSLARDTSHSLIGYNAISLTPKLDHNIVEYKSYGYRWLIQFSFTLCLATTGIIMVGFSPVAAIVAKIY